MHSQLKLEPLVRAHAPLLREMAREFQDEGDPRFDLVLEDSERFFASVDRDAAGDDLPPDRVPQSHFVALAADRLVGAGRLRHRLIPVLHRDGGHIGYEVRRTERGKGYGTALLSLLLDRARALGLDRVLLTAAATNAPSLRVIERNGGIRDGTAISHRTGEEMVRSWIHLS